MTTLKKICENTSSNLNLLNSTSCPTFDSAHLDGLALGPVFRVPPVQKGVIQQTAPGAARRHNFLGFFV